MALENWKEAWALLRQALKTNPHLPSWANTAFAVVLLHLGQKEAAKASLKDALDANVSVYEMACLEGCLPGISERGLLGTCAHGHPHLGRDAAHSHLRPYRHSFRS